MVKKILIFSVTIMSLLILFACQKECSVSDGMKEIILMVKDRNRTKVSVVDTPPATLAICCIRDGVIKSKPINSSYQSSFGGYRTGLYTSAWHDYNTGEDKGVKSTTFYVANVDQNDMSAFVGTNIETGLPSVDVTINVDNLKDYVVGKMTSDLINPTLEMKHILARIGTVKAICNGGDNYYNNGSKGYFKDAQFDITLHSVDEESSEIMLPFVGTGTYNIEKDTWSLNSNAGFSCDLYCQTVSNVCVPGEEPDGYYTSQDKWVIPVHLKVSFSCVYCSITGQTTTEKTLTFTDCDINLLPGKINNIVFNIIYDDGNVELTYKVEVGELPDENVIVGFN